MHSGMMISHIMNWTIYQSTCLTSVELICQKEDAHSNFAKILYFYCVFLFLICPKQYHVTDPAATKWRQIRKKTNKAQ